MAFPAAMGMLSRRLGATVEEVAAWIANGPEDGGLAAYVKLGGGRPPRRFRFTSWATAPELPDLREPLAWAWFSSSELERFEPRDRFITGQALLDRWNAVPWVDGLTFMRVKLDEARLSDMHPITGLTQATVPESFLPPIEMALFAMSEVQAIEREDFGAELAGPTEGVERVTGSSNGSCRGDAERSSPEAARCDDVVTPEEKKRAQRVRALRLKDRLAALKAAGVKDFLCQVAKEEGVSPRRVRQLIDSVKPAGPMIAMTQSLLSGTSSTDRKDYM